MSRAPTPPSFHEDFTPQPPRRGSDRAFGLVFAAVFAFIGFVPLLHGGMIRLWGLGLALLLLAATVLRPKSLSLLNIVWFRFGILLSSITLPLLLAVVFYGVLTPIALLRRLVGARGLALRREATAPSYWITRKDPPGRESLKQQF